MLQLLLAAGADVRRPFAPKANASHYAVFKMFPQVIRVLKGHKGFKEACSARGESELWGSLGACTAGELGSFVIDVARSIAKDVGVVA